jgi:hypothetical protein
MADENRKRKATTPSEGEKGKKERKVETTKETESTLPARQKRYGAKVADTSDWHIVCEYADDDMRLFNTTYFPNQRIVDLVVEHKDVRDILTDCYKITKDFIPDWNSPPSDDEEFLRAYLSLVIHGTFSVSSKKAKEDDNEDLQKLWAPVAREYIARFEEYIRNKNYPLPKGIRFLFFIRPDANPIECGFTCRNTGGFNVGHCTLRGVRDGWNVFETFNFRKEPDRESQREKTIAILH